MWKLRVSEEEEGDKWLKSVNRHIGRQYWEYDPNLGTPSDIAQIEEFRHRFHEKRHQIKHSSDLLMRFQFAKGKADEKMPPKEEDREELEGVISSLRKALRFYSTLQAEDGNWPGDYTGPLFLLPSLVMGLHVTGSLNTILSSHHQQEICRYMYNHQNADGGWGLHIEGHSTMFCTVLQYACLRLMGEKIDGGDGAMEKARKWVIDRGGAIFIPSWGKFWLSVIGAYDWRGNNPLPPEAWLLPYLLPIHPGRMWCHLRMVYLSMSYLYGRKFVGAVDSTVLSLRKELYTTPYHLVDWDQTRFLCAKEDLYYPHTKLQYILWDGAHKLAEPLVKKWPFSILRKKALNTVIQHIHYEDENTNYVCLGPVTKVLNMVCCWVEDPNSDEFKLHLSRVKDYLWLAEDGMKMQGYNGSQLWDVAFAVQAILSTNLPDEYGSMLKKAHNFIKNTQIRNNSSGDLSSYYRHISKGGWPFSTADIGWIAADCTAEGLKVALLLSRCSFKNVGEAIAEDRLYDAVHVLLSLQNSNGGFASYELTRSYAWLEVINPTETFGDTVIDYQYVECTSAVIQALKSFITLHPRHRKKEVLACIAKAVDFIQTMQLPDGSWYGSWGVCFTYGTWFGIKGLVAASKTYENSDNIRRACDFLLSKQLDCGGWGESYLSCQDKVYTNLEGNRSHTVNTSWAMLALLEAGQANRDPKSLHRAAKVLMDSQMENGDFSQQEIIGVFNKSCMISYSAYRNIFPIWALGEYRNHVSRILE